MKKLLSSVAAIAMAAIMLTACTAAPQASSAESSKAESSTAESSMAEESAQAKEETPAARAEVRLAGMTGPTSMGMVKMLNDSEQDLSMNSYKFTIAGSADEITPKLVKGELDIAAVPANLASVLYNNTDGAVQMLAVNTKGVLYLCEKGDTIKTLADLKGKTIYATGKGSTPEYTLRYLLTSNGMDPDKDVSIEWKSEPTEIVALLSKADSGIAMLPQPYVTVAQTKVEGLRVAANLGEEWGKLGSELVTGVVVARKEFVEQNPMVIASFLDEYEDSIEWVTENAKDASVLIEKYGIVNAAVAEKALPQCNLDYEDGDDMKEDVSAYLNILMSQNPKSIGGKMPGEDFYYSKD